MTPQSSIRTRKKQPEPLRGFFGIGVEAISKSFNVGNLFRSAHAFGASFVFTVNASYRRRDGKQTDTSDSMGSVPFYSFPTVPEMILPHGCVLVGVEFLEDAVELPSFRHPRQAAYVMGPERNSLSPEMLAKCDHVIRIPTKFCLNVGIAGVIVMYDRIITHGRFAERPLLPGGPKLNPEELPPSKYRAAAPLAEVELAESED